MDEARTKAWIMYALELASQAGPANFAAISQVADGINHAVPTQKELRSSLSWLVSRELVQKRGSGYQITPQGSFVIHSASTGHSTTFQVWESLTSALRAMSA